MALSDNYNSPDFSSEGPVPERMYYPQKTTTHIYKSALVMMDGNGYALPGAAASGNICVGRSRQEQNNTGASGAVFIEVDQGVFLWDINGSAATIANVGSLCYIYDDHTVTLSSTNASIAGTIQLVDAVSGKVWVYSGLAAPISSSTLTGFIADIESTAAGVGAGLVGVADTGSLLSAANVEDALAEVLKKANAALGVPVSCRTVLSAATTGSTVFTFLPGVAGKVRTLDASVAVIATTAATMTAQVYISDTAVTGASLALTTTNCATLGHRVSGTVASGSNTFSATQTVSIQFTGATKFSEGEAQLLIFLASA